MWSGRQLPTMTGHGRIPRDGRPETGGCRSGFFDGFANSVLAFIFGGRLRVRFSNDAVYSGRRGGASSVWRRKGLTSEDRFATNRLRHPGTCTDPVASVNPISIQTLAVAIRMSSSAQLRLMSDLKAIRNEPPEGCSASPHAEENLFVWGATIFGPDETPWEGGIFGLRLIFGENYPEKPPRVRFTSEVFHPNVYHDGTLCMDIIQDAWSPCHNVCTILTSIQSLLTDPNPASPANPEAAQLYQNDIQAYNRRVRRCARKSIDSA